MSVSVYLVTFFLKEKNEKETRNKKLPFSKFPLCDYVSCVLDFGNHVVHPHSEELWFWVVYERDFAECCFILKVIVFCCFPSHYVFTDLVL